MEFKELDDIAFVKGGKRLPKGQMLVTYKTKHPYLRISDYDKKGKVDLKKIQYVKNETFEEIKNYIISKGDVFLSIVGTIGIVDYINDELDGASLTENAVKITVKDNEKYNPIFLTYYLKSPSGQFEIHSRTVGTTQKKLAIKRIKKINVPVILLDKQKRIASILSNLDSKIEINNKIISNLESQAQAIFKSWFVDFEPFQDGDFVESELGMIPEGWEVKKVNEICDLKIGRTPPRKESEWFSLKEGVKWVSIKDLGLSQMYISEVTEYLTEESIEKFNIPIVEENTLLLSFKLTVGRIAITTEKMCTNEAIAQFKDPLISTLFLFYYFKNFKFETLGNTSSIGNAVNSKIIKNIEVLVPPEKIVLKVMKMIEPLSICIRNLLNQNTKLAELRDALLPKLMAGEIDVSNIKIEGEEVKNE